jgi:hypothetical protein
MRTHKIVQETADPPPPDDVVQARINLVIDGYGQFLRH